MASDVTPKVVEVDQLVISMTQSLIAASELVNNMSGRDSPHIYVVPEMSVSINLSFTFEEGRVKGILGRTQSKETQQVDSTIGFQIKAIPRPAQSGSLASTSHLPPPPPPPPTPSS